uniref:polypeptide N-acetylgalactosaminyltransferase 17-like n=1 Tax=Doryrhamphus excisus TaxID=161450 RepID=UPI0025ADB50F|nr:polypeptide N-acetylgalactosaminyltransferase 17-like [Doryrhamphus excisus]
MAVRSRRWKLLLLINGMGLVGFMTVWTAINTRPFQKIFHPDIPVDARRPRLTGWTTKDELGNRVKSLEDIVYGHMNGLSKSLGLIEGGNNGSQNRPLPTVPPNKKKEAQNVNDHYGYNVYLSDRISLDRTIPDFRPSRCKELSYPSKLPQIALIFIFVNEALSIILRAVHSAVNHTPPHLLKEIILVDDHSDHEQLKGPLENYVKKRYPGLVKIIRNQKREGLIRARLEGWKVATAEVTGFFDAHVEFTPFWAEPILSRIKEDRTRIVLPTIDNIKHDTFEVQPFSSPAHGFDWQLWCLYAKTPIEWLQKNDDTAPMRSPAMIGCSFLVNRVYFEELGLFDPGMDIYGGENVELAIRAWTCGGSMEILPCSRVAHLARVKKPYLVDNIYTPMRRNALRVAEVWMDELKFNVYMAWNINMEKHGIDYGDISERVELRKRLQCKNFQWYLDNIYPSLGNFNNTIRYGDMRNSEVKNLCLDQGADGDNTVILYQCHGMWPQLTRYTTEYQLMLGSLGTFSWSARCLVDDPSKNEPQHMVCNQVKDVQMTKWIYSQNKSVINMATGRCLEVVPIKEEPFAKVVLQTCSGQWWTINHFNVVP